MQGVDGLRCRLVRGNSRVTPPYYEASYQLLQGKISVSDPKT